MVYWNMIKVLHLSKGYPPTPGGVENATLTFSKLSTELGFDTEVICHGTRNSIKSINGVTVREIKPLLKIMGQPLSGFFLLRGLWQGLRANTIHAHVPDYLTLLVIITVAIFVPKKKIIIHWHSDVIGKGITQYLLRQLEFLAIRKCSLVIFGSPDYLEYSYAKQFCMNKYKVIPYTSSKTMNVDNEQLVSDNSYIELVSVGRLVEYKGFSQLISSLPKQPKLKLTIVGSGPLRKELDNLILELGLESRVSLVGNLNDGELSQLLLRSDLFILNSQSRAESYGIVLVEALMCGLPILTRFVEGSGMNFINNNKKFGLIYHDESEIGVYAQQLVSGLTDRSQVSAYAVQRFGINAFKKNAAQIYGE